MILRHRIPYIRIALSGGVTGPVRIWNKPDVQIPLQRGMEAANFLGKADLGEYFSSVKYVLKAKTYFLLKKDSFRTISGKESAVRKASIGEFKCKKRRKPFR